MSHPLLYVRVDGYQLSPTVRAVVSEYVVASPDDIGRAAERLGYVKADKRGDVRHLRDGGTGSRPGLGGEPGPENPPTPACDCGGAA